MLLIELDYKENGVNMNIPPSMKLYPLGIFRAMH